jgi:DNA-binding MarR family transcriptional regulator
MSKQKAQSPAKKNNVKSQENNATVDRIGHLVSLLERLMRKEISEALIPINLTLQQYAALLILNNNEKISNAKLAKRSFMTPQSANEMVLALEEKALVIRQPDENHGRIIHIMISKEGKKLLRKADAAVLDIEQRMLKAIGGNDRAILRDQLIACISALKDATLPEFPLDSSPKL